MGWIAVRRRADVSSVLVARKEDGANIVYVEDNETAGEGDFKEFG